MAKRIGLLTGGGDAPGLNVCLKSIVYNAIDRGFQVVGIRKGWEGLVYYQPESSTTHAENVMIMNKSRVRDIDRMAGSFLHSSRLNPGRANPATVPLFLRQGAPTTETMDLTPHIKRVLDKLQLDCLVVLGDKATLQYAARLNADGVPIIGIPKTVHNDVSGSDYCLGFSTALSRGVHFVQEIRAMAGSREEVAVIEILGRSTSPGITTLLISLLSGADRALIPEVPFDPERLVGMLSEDKRANPTNYAVLIMSESASIEPDKAEKYRAAWSKSRGGGTGRPQAADEELALAVEREPGAGASGGGAAVTEILEKLMGQRLLLQPLSYLLRTGEPDGQDLLGAMNFGAMAVSLIADGKTGRLVAYRRQSSYCDLPLDVVNGQSTLLAADHYDLKSYRPLPSVLWATRI